MKDTINFSLENYLKTILEIESEGEQVAPALLAQRLDVSRAAVSNAVKRMSSEGYVTFEADKIIRLAEKGREIAYRTALRHHLIERMLSEVFGMEWHQIHEEAERLEHVVSPAFEAKLKEKLGEGACPHGNGVLPESYKTKKKRGEVPLSEAQAGKSYVVQSLHERDPQLLLFLHQNGIGPGKHLAIVNQNYDQTVLIQLNNTQMTLGKMAAEAVWLKQII